MRTTLDLPDDLFRKVKARAAVQGVKMKDLVAEYLQQGLETPVVPPTRSAGHRRPVPIVRPATGVPLPALSNAEIEEILLAEDVERAVRG
jgi:plasmid stability protein